MSLFIKLSCAVIVLLPAYLFAQREVIRDNCLDVNHVLYGDVTKMDDMFINPADYDGPDSEEEPENKHNRRKNDLDPNLDFNIPLKSIIFETIFNPYNNSGFDINDFNIITKTMNNVSRRFYYDDPEDYWSYREPRKKKELINAGLQFLIHSRYKIAGAIKQKEPIKSDKRYRLGYLFNRLRRLQYEMSKLIDQATKQGYYTGTKEVFRFYDQTIRYHIDAKDTIEYIKFIDAEPDPVAPETTTEPDSPLKETTSIKTLLRYN